MPPAAECGHVPAADYERTESYGPSAYGVPRRLREDIARYSRAAWIARRYRASLRRSPAVSIDAVFSALADAWETDTKFVSSIPKIVMHPAHQKIIGMGREVLPLILRRMRDRGGYWFWALETIARESPILAEHAGHAESMKRAWLDWGTERGLI